MRRSLGCPRRLPRYRCAGRGADLYLARRVRPPRAVEQAAGSGGKTVTTYAVAGPSLLRTTTKPPSAQAPPPIRRPDRAARRQHGVSPDLVRAVIQAESGFNPRAVSPKGAMGLMQLMPATARELGVGDPFHPAENIRGGVTYLAGLLARYDQKWSSRSRPTTPGPASVERYGAVPPYRETQDYVKKITGATRPHAAPPPTGHLQVDRAGRRPAQRPATRTSRPRTARYEVVGASRSDLGSSASNPRAPRAPAPLRVDPRHGPSPTAVHDMIQCSRPSKIKD